eukprot:6482683-Amphidinium_carterae.1
MGSRIGADGKPGYQDQGTEGSPARNTVKDWAKSQHMAETLDKKRQVTLSYRGWEWLQLVTSAEEQIELVLMSAVREIATRLELIHELPGESSIVMSDVEMSVTSMDEGLYQDALTLRNFLKKILKSEKIQPGTSVEVINQESTPERKPHQKQTEMGVLKANSSACKRHDRLAVIDVEFLKHVTGQGGSKQVEKMFADACMASETKDISITKARAEAQKIVDGELYKYVSPAAHGTMEALCECLSKIEKDTAPQKFSNGGEFAVRVWNGLQWFA